MVRSAAPPRLFEDPDDLLNFPDIINVDDFITQIIEANEAEPVSSNYTWDESGAGRATLQAAEICAAKMLRFVMRMGCGDLSRFWHSCGFLSCRQHLSVRNANFPICSTRVANWLRNRLQLHDASACPGSIHGSCLVCSTVGTCLEANTPKPKPGLSSDGLGIDTY